jgi:hypothetical protein
MGRVAMSNRHEGPKFIRVVFWWILLGISLLVPALALFRFSAKPYYTSFSLDGLVEATTHDAWTPMLGSAWMCLQIPLFVVLAWALTVTWRTLPSTERMWRLVIILAALPMLLFYGRVFLNAFADD